MTVRGSASASPRAISGSVLSLISEAADATGDYLSAKSKQWAEAARQRLTELDEQTEATRRQLAEKAEQLGDEAKARYHEAMKNLEDEKQAVKSYWESLKEKTGPALEEARQGFEAAMNEAAEGLRQAREKLNSPDPATDETNAGS